MFKYNHLDKRFGRLVAIEYESPYWVCQCDCGKTTKASGGNLRSGSTQSCGCLLKERTTKHGMHDSKTYQTWESMKQRCYNPNYTHYSYYGGKGISVCNSWHNFSDFYKDMGNRPKGMSLDRIDPLKDYSKSNCRWASATTQARNRQAQKNSKTGISGVGFYKRMSTYRVRIKVNKKEVHVGIFDDFFEAVCARKTAELKYWSHA